MISQQFSFDNEKCLICGANNPENGHFWREHNIKVSTYYEQNYPRNNLLTGEKLSFNAKESYFLNDFDDKEQLKSYLSTLSIEKRKNYCLNLIKKRTAIKRLKYLPCQVELKSLIAPTVSYYDKLFNDYYNLAKELSLINKFEKYQNLPRIPKSTILVDSREQTPVLNKEDCEITTLKYGDYTISGSNVCVERKSISDWLGVMSNLNGFQRFIKELERVQQDNKHLIIMVENNINQCLEFNKLPQIKKFTSKITPAFVFHNVREICQGFSNVQFLFASGRTEMNRLIKKILFTPGIERFDLELAYEKNEI